MAVLAETFRLWPPRWMFPAGSSRSVVLDRGTSRWGRFALFSLGSLQRDPVRAEANRSGQTLAAPRPAR